MPRSNENLYYQPYNNLDKRDSGYAITSTRQYSRENANAFKQIAPQLNRESAPYKDSNQSLQYRTSHLSMLQNFVSSNDYHMRSKKGSSNDSTNQLRKAFEKENDVHRSHFDYSHQRVNDNRSTLEGNGKLGLMPVRKAVDSQSTSKAIEKNQSALTSHVATELSSNSSYHEMSLSPQPPISRNVVRRVQRTIKKRATKEQVEFLEGVFAENKFPTTDQKGVIATHLEMNPHAVSVWFQNKRQADKASREANGLMVPKRRGQRGDLKIPEASEEKNSSFSA